MGLRGSLAWFPQVSSFCITMGVPVGPRTGYQSVIHSNQETCWFNTMGPLAMYASQHCKMHHQNLVTAACQLNFLKVNFLEILCLNLIIITVHLALDSVV